MGQQQDNTATWSQAAEKNSHFGEGVGASTAGRRHGGHTHLQRCLWSPGASQHNATQHIHRVSSDVGPKERPDSVADSNIPNLVQHTTAKHQPRNHELTTNDATATTASMYAHARTCTVLSQPPLTMVLSSLGSNLRENTVAGSDVCDTAQHARSHTRP